jgi:DNA polymerase-3 subunit alpha
MRLSTLGYTEGFYYRPRIDTELLRAHSAGIIATSACVAGAIPRAILAGDRKKAGQIAEEYLSIFGEGNFYFELQNHGIDEEIVAFEEMKTMGRQMGIPFIVANDAHYLNREDAPSHEILLCIQTQTTINDPNRYRFSSDQIYFKSPEEMAELFADMPDALSNTVEIAERCNVDITAEPQFPHAGFGPEFPSENEYIRHLAAEGLARRYREVTPELKERLEYELEVICKMEFAGYFLVVHDFIKAAERMDIMTGCRGSAAGSLVAYALGITQVDPIRFDLIFERFLNPERISMPDADIDFADRDRHRIIEYVVQKYGRESVCQISNFGRMKSKLVVRDVARVMGLSVAEAGKLAGMVLDKTLLEESIAANGELKDALKNNPTYAELFKHARVLEGLARQAGTHAGGVIIAPGPVVNWAPLFKQSSGASEDALMSQYDMNYVERVGLIKMDFLGLRTLTVLQDTLKLVLENHNVTIDLWALPDNDGKTYELLGRGETIGIFQFESQGMQDNLRKLKPGRIDDLIAMNALYRPGPMDNIPTYIHRKHGREKVDYLHPLLKNTLEVTYGVVVYQEQVMRIAQILGGFTLGQADVLRKAMSKKNTDTMEKMGRKFIEGAQKKGIPVVKAQEIFDYMAKFGGYGFNKAHAAAYAHVAYQSAYLKAHYPVEFLTATLSSVLDDQDYLLMIKNEAERMGIRILPPHVNKSEIRCSIDEGAIRIGLNAIKNVGEQAADSIICERKKKGVFSSLFDLCASVDLRQVNKKCIEALVCAGALDGLKGTRAQLFASTDKAIDYGNGFQKDRQTGQTSLFDIAAGSKDTQAIAEPALATVPPWPYLELLAREKEVLNFYVSGHPLDRYQDELRGFADTSLGIESLKKLSPGVAVTVGGIVTSVKTHMPANGKQMAFLTLEDFEGSMELISFNDSFEKFRNLLAPDSMILVRGQVTMKEDEAKPKLKVENVMAFSDTREKLSRSVHIRLNTNGLEEPFMKEICKECSVNKGACALVIHLATLDQNEYRIKSRNCTVDPGPETIENLRKKLGKENVWISKTPA